jgi:hypothetical protein
MSILASLEPARRVGAPAALLLADAGRITLLGRIAERLP